MSWPALLVTFGSLFALACGGSSSGGPTGTAPAAINQPIELAPGQSAQLGPLRITFTGVSGDSRCPVDVTCVWEGDAKVAIEVITPTPRAEHELHTSGRDSREATHGAYHITLVKLEPAPRSTATISQGDYRATLVVVR